MKRQLVKSATSDGANYEGLQDSPTRHDDQGNIFLRFAGFTSLIEIEAMKSAFDHTIKEVIFF